jgi:hypothetical protein
VENQAPVFSPVFDRYNRPHRIVTLLGTYMGSTEMLEAHGVLNIVRESGLSALNPESEYAYYTQSDVRQTQDDVKWTRWIMALNKGRKWVRTRLLERLAPMLEPGIALAVVPSHNPFNTDPPIRLLAQELAATDNRIDLTDCLVRHTRIPRIVYGGQSSRMIHLSTIALNEPERIAGQRVLLLDDIAKSGQSLMTCRELLLGSGATVVQAAALGRVR